MLRAQLRSIWRAIFRRSQIDEELSDEFRFHVEARARDIMAREGGSRAEAIRRALIEFGAGDRYKEAVRDGLGFRLFHQIGADLRYAIRQLRANLTFAMAAIGSIAIGIAATCAAFTFLDALVLNPMPYPGADRMFTVSVQNAKGEGRGGVALNGREFAEFQKLDGLDGAIATAMWDVTMSGDPAVHVRAAQFSGNVFDYYQVRMLRGRPFTESDAPLTDLSQPVVVLSHRFWMSQFGGDEAAINGSLRLDGEPFTIVGVAPPRFRLLDADVYMPLRRPLDPNNYYGIEGRIRDGLAYGIEGARLRAPTLEAVLQPFVARLIKERPGRFPPDARDVGLVASVVVRGARFHSTFTLLIVATATLLAVGMCNVSILLLARGTARRRELTLRAALGASRGRLVGQLLIESSVVASLGGVLGVALAWTLVPAIVKWLPSGYLPNDVVVGVHPSVLAITTGVATLTGILFGLLPAIQLSRVNARLSVQSDEWASTSRAAKRVHHALIAGQVALSVLLLAGAGTALTAYRALTTTPLNFDPNRVLVSTVSLVEGSYADWAARSVFFDQVRTRVSTLPGVQHAGFSFGFVCCAGPAVPPLQPMLLEGREGMQPATVHRATPDLFSVLNMSVRGGRTWTESEHAQAARVAVVARGAAQQLWPGQDPLGRRLRLPQLKARSSWESSAPGSDGWLEVIGVLADVPTTGLQQPSRWPVVYVPFTLNMGDIAKLVVRTHGAPLSMVKAIQGAIRAVDPNQPLSNPETAIDIIRATGSGRHEMVASVLLLVASMALVLASVGLYSVVSFIASQGTREFGIRRALGARSGTLVWQALKSTVIAIGVGAALGIALSMTIDRLVTQLAELRTRDPLTIVGVVGVLCVAALVATLIPARRASRVDPMIALKCD